MNPSALPETKPEDLSIAAMWAFFETVVLPADVSAVQRQEMKNAYYAGFIDCFKLTGDVSTKLTEEKSFEVLSRVRAEAHEHFLVWFGSVAEQPAVEAKVFTAEEILAAFEVAEGWVAQWVGRELEVRDLWAALRGQPDPGPANPVANPGGCR